MVPDPEYTREVWRSFNLQLECTDERSVLEGTEQRDSALDPVPLCKRARNLDPEHKVGRVACGGQRAGADERLVDWAVVDSFGWLLPVLLCAQLRVKRRLRQSGNGIHPGKVSLGSGSE